MANNNKEDSMKEQMNAPKNIDTTVNFNIPRSDLLFDPKKHKYKCFCCGKPFTIRKNNFKKSNSPLFQSNDGYLPWCNDCTDAFYNKLVAFYSGNEAHAIEHFCQIADWVYELNPLIASKETYDGHRDRSRISHYAAKKNLNVEGRKTFFDTLKNNFKNGLGNIITDKSQTKSDDVTVSASAIDRWGVGFSEMDYKNLDEHYRQLKKFNPNADQNQEIFIKNLCSLNMLMVRALQSGDSKEYATLTEQYAKTFKQAGLKTIAEKDGSNDEVFGVTLATISQFTPEEYYKDKELFADFDDIGDYYDRHILRPMRNLMFDEDVRDKEFYVHEEDDDEE